MMMGNNLNELSINSLIDETKDLREGPNRNPNAMASRSTCLLHVDSGRP